MRVSRTRSRKEKIGLLAERLAAARGDELPIAVGFLAGQLRQGKLGVGPSIVEEARQASPAAEPSLAPPLTLDEVDRRLTALAAEQGAGAVGRRTTQLGALMAAATADEQRFLADLLLGSIRQGALEGIMADAVAQATGVPASAVRRAVMLHGDLGHVAQLAATGGAAALHSLGLELFRPIQPMLAQPTADPDDALGVLGRASVEYKLDGARVQVHKQGARVEVYTRGLHRVTAAVPELVQLVRTLSADALVLDGEVLALRSDGTPHPFQVTMRRFGRRLDVDAMRQQLPLSAFFFDCLRLGAQTLLDEPTTERLRALDELVPAAHRVPREHATAPEQAAAFFDRAITAGHEGVMLKALDQPYQAGRRGKAWLKLKPAHTLDLVVLAVEPGSGRREGWLSNLHLGARDPATGGFVMLGKTFKGMTDAMLQWQTERLRSLEIGREGFVVHVRPELVVEVAFGDVQRSPQYPGGMALRFARVKRYREDKPASEADTIERVREIFEQRG